MVGPRGLEPRTSPLSGARSHHLLKSASDAGPAGVSAPLVAPSADLVPSFLPSSSPSRARVFCAIACRQPITTLGGGGCRGGTPLSALTSGLVRWAYRGAIAKLSCPKTWRTSSRSPVGLPEDGRGRAVAGRGSWPRCGSNSQEPWPRMQPLSLSPPAEQR